MQAPSLQLHILIQIHMVALLSPTPTTPPIYDALPTVSIRSPYPYVFMAYYTLLLE